MRKHTRITLLLAIGNGHPNGRGATLRRRVNQDDGGGPDMFFLLTLLALYITSYLIICSHTLGEL